MNTWEIKCKISVNIERHDYNIIFVWHYESFEVRHGLSPYLSEHLVQAYYHQPYLK